MSFYSDASLVLIPSGYKDQKIYCAKPTDGSADLVFTRASSATRVASNGLIEKVRTNILTYSNTFSNAAWSKVGGTTLTAGQTDYLGGTNAWKWEATGTGTIQLAQNPAGATIRTASIYAKAGSVSTLNLWIGSAVTFNLSTGTVTSGTGVITSVGNGWYRCSAFGAGIIHNPYFASATAGDYVLISFAQMDEGDIATDYIATTTAAVSVGPVSGLPRLDYLNSTCPRLLLEPQRTNLVTFSEQFDNAAWGKTQATVTANQAVSPDGYTNADLLVDNSSLSGHVTQQTAISVPSSQAITISGYYKDKDIRYAGMRLFVPTNGTDVGRFSIVVDLQTGAITSTLTSGATIANLSYDVTSVGNGWYRLRITGTSPAGNAGIMAWLSPSATPTNDGFATATYSGTGKGCYLYGFQAELGAYASSYIPTLSTSVTRLADAASKTGISSLIGQTEGTMYWEGTSDGIGASVNLMYFNAATNSVVLTKQGNNIVRAIVQQTSGTFNLNSTAVSGKFKVAIAYKSGDSALYVNGNLAQSSSAAISFGAALTELNLGVGINYFAAVNKSECNQALLFKTRLTNAQLAELTTL